MGSIVARNVVKRKPGMLYYIDGSGNACEAAMKHGGKKKAAKKKAAPKRKAAKRKPAKKKVAKRKRRAKK